MHILITNFYGNPNVGLYGYANDSYCLMGEDVPKHLIHQIGQVLKVPVHTITICGTSLVGAFCAGNNKKLLVPGIAFKEELARLKELKIDFEVISTKHTALGNNLLCNDFGCLANPDFSADEKKKIRQALGVKLHPGNIAGLGIVGSLAAHNKHGCLIHRDASNKEIKEVQTLLNTKCETGTLNMANPYIRSSIICNSNGFIVGDACGGPEIANTDEVLGFLKKEVEEKVLKRKKVL